MNSCSSDSYSRESLASITSLDTFVNKARRLNCYRYFDANIISAQLLFCKGVVVESFGGAYADSATGEIQRIRL